MHLVKIKQSEVGGLMGHDLRTRSSHKNKDIDVSRTRLNFNLASGNWKENLDKRLNDVQKFKRGDVNVMCSWVVTLPKELDQNKPEAFMKHMFKFLSERYGVENVVSAYVHVDETTPHMHFKFIPVKDGRLNAKEVINRNELKVIHKEADDYIAEIYGSKGLINNKAMLGKENLELDTFKYQNQLELIKKEIKRDEEVKQKLENEIKWLNTGLERRRNELQDLEEIIPTVELKARERAKNEPLWAKMLKVYDDLRAELSQSDLFESIRSVLDTYLECRENGLNRIDSFYEAIEEVKNQVEERER